MAGALHDGLRALEADVATKTVSDAEVRGAHHQEPELLLAQFLVELGVAAARDVDRKRILRLLDHIIFQCIVFGVSRERSRDGLAKALVLTALPKLFAIAAIEVAQCVANQRVGAGFAKLGLQDLDQRHQDLRLYFGLLDDGNAHLCLAILTRLAMAWAAGPSCKTRHWDASR